MRQSHMACVTAHVATQRMSVYKIMSQNAKLPMWIEATCHCLLQYTVCEAEPNLHDTTAMQHKHQTTYLEHSCLECFQQGSPLAPLCILSHPSQEVLIVSLRPSPPHQVLKGLQQGEQGIPGLNRLESSYQV